MTVVRLRWITLFAVAVPVAAEGRVQQARAAEKLAPPPTRREAIRDDYHGVEIVDPYRWLEDQQSAETRQWIEAQNAYTESVLETFEGRDRLAARATELLTGYGGFSVSNLPRFSARAAIWVENGGVYALANLRGGGEFGEAWHEAGMLADKQNTFDDFFAAAEWLIDNNITSPDRLAISGRSNGGLLVGAAVTQRPELFQAAVCGYPLLDMLRYHRFLVARFWISEYGSADDPDQFAWLHAYSPYHRVEPGTPYPAVLFITGDADTRVAPLHARKMAARLQHATTSDRPILLRYNTTAGHTGQRPTSKRVDDLTAELSFLCQQLESCGAR